jgi:hypothetical protein
VDLWPPWSESPRWWEMLKTRKMIYDHWPLYIYNYIIYVYTYIHILRWHTFYPDLKQKTFFSVEVWRHRSHWLEKIQNGARTTAPGVPRFDQRVRGRCRGECRWRMETGRACRARRAWRIRMRKSRTVQHLRIFNETVELKKRGYNQWVIIKYNEYLLMYINVVNPMINLPIKQPFGTIVNHPNQGYIQK